MWNAWEHLSLWVLGTEINGASEHPYWSVYCHRISGWSVRLCVADTSALFSCSEAVPLIFFKQAIASSERSSFKSFYLQQDKQLMVKLDAPIVCAFFKPLCASFQTGFEISTSYRFLKCLFLLFPTKCAVSPVVMAMETPPGHGYSSIDWTTEILFLAAGWTPRLWKIPFQVSGFTLQYWLTRLCLNHDVRWLFFFSALSSMSKWCWFWVTMFDCVEGTER